MKNDTTKNIPVDGEQLEMPLPEVSEKPDIGFRRIPRGKPIKTEENLKM